MVQGSRWLFPRNIAHVIGTGGILLAMSPILVASGRQWLALFPWETGMLRPFLTGLVGLLLVLVAQRLSGRPVPPREN